MNSPPSLSGIPGPEPAPKARKPGTRLGWYLHLCLVTAYPIVIGILGRDRAHVQYPALGHRPAALLWVSAMQLLTFGIVLGVAWLGSRASRADLLWRWRGGAWIIPAGIGYSVALRLLIGLVVAFSAAVLLALRITTPQHLQEFIVANRPDVGAIVDLKALHQNPAYFWLSVTVVSFVVGGFREELWRSAFLAGTRALWPSRFGSTAGQLAASGLAAIAFALGHLAQGPLAVCLAGVLGFGLGVILVLHRSIWPAVIAHGSFDATSMALLPWLMEHFPKSLS